MRSFLNLTDNLQKLSWCYGLNSETINTSEVADIMSHNVLTSCGNGQFEYKFIIDIR